MTMLWLSLQGDVCSRRFTFTLYTAGYNVVYIIVSWQWYKCKTSARLAPIHASCSPNVHACEHSHMEILAASTNCETIECNSRWKLVTRTLAGCPAEPSPGCVVVSMMVYAQWLRRWFADLVAIVGSCINWRCCSGQKNMVATRNRQISAVWCNTSYIGW